jgi:hypothetical protein
MKDEASIRVRVSSWVLAGTVCFSTARASAAEEWPPRTPPRVPGATPPATKGPTAWPPPAVPGAAPAPSTPAAGAPPVAAPPSEAPPAPEAKPEAPPPAERPASSEAAHADATAVRAAPEPAAVPMGGRTAGVTENRFFVRTGGNELVLFPGGLLQVDGRSFRTSNLDVPDNGVSVQRARLELAGLVGGVVGFNAGVDLARGASLRGVDEYVSVAPAGDRVIVQAGQFDAPFTMDNRTSDRGLDFLERSLLARALAIPGNKKQGGMVHGTNAARNYYYSAGGFFGDGQTDGMARAWVAPLSFTRGGVPILRDVTVGGSAWLGHARRGTAVAPQTTQSGFVLLDTTTRWLDGTDVTDVSLRTRGNMNAFAVELNAPIRHKFGARFEWAMRDQPLEVYSVRNLGMPAATNGAQLNGWATYGEVWFWAYGDDRVVGEQGLQLPLRLGEPVVARPQPAAMVAARIEYLHEDLSPGTDPGAMSQVISRGETNVTALTVGANLWFARRLRATMSYTWNHPSGGSLFLTSLTDANIHELSLRFSLAL